MGRRFSDQYRRLFEEWLTECGENTADYPCFELSRDSLPVEIVATHLMFDRCVLLPHADAN